MATTMSLIAKQTVGADGATSVTFSNIPQTFTDLKLVASMRSTRAATNDTLTLQINSTNITGRRLYGDGSGAASDTTPQVLPPAANATANTFSNTEFYIPNYASTTQYKSVSIDDTMENNATASYMDMIAGIYSANTAVTSITLDLDNGNFPEFSTFYLYGISNSSTQNTSVPKASGGDVITTDGTYWYHAFKYSGTFTPIQSINADVLVIAGGGGGGGQQFGGGGGGGGAGGVCYQTARSLIANTSITCTVGAGGTRGADTQGTNGANSVFDTITGLGGGGGGCYGDPTATPGKSGGSGGGGGGYQTSSSILGGAATQGSSGGATGYGFAGGNGVLNNFTTGGGGGSGAVGSNGNSNVASGSGGAGKNTWSSWASATETGVSGYYAGGGGGGSRADQTPTAGTGGSGGGGNGGANANGANATANTGSGGGGGGNNGSPTYGGNGGSGIIIVRYAVV